MSECRIQLRRDTVNTPWGFRLQGGHEYNSPLFIQRVFSGSPADGRLQRGDVFASINNHDVSRMEQKQAEDIIKAAGSALALVVKRTGAGTEHDSLLTFANEPQSQPVSMGFDNAYVQQPTPPAAVPTAHRGPSASYGASLHLDGPRVPSAAPQSKKTNVVMWSPGGGGGSSSINADQPSYGQGHAGDISAGHHHVPAARPAAPGGQQFSTNAGYGGHGGQDRGPPWQARDGGGGGAWSQSHHGAPAAAASSEHHRQRQPQQQQQQQRARMQAQRDAHPAKTSHGVREESPRTGAPEVIRSVNMQDDEDTYEQKSVHQIKAMFNKPSKPSVPGPQQQRTFNKPRMMQDAGATALSPTSSRWSSSSHDKYSQFPSQTQSFSPASQPVEERPSFLQQHADLIANYPPPREKLVMPTPDTGLIKPSSTSAPKPGAGYSYQGIANVTPPKPVHHHGPGSGGSTSTAGKKKEFDPSQSLVFQMLQEESERAKRGDVGEPMEEEANLRRQQQQQQQQQHWQQQQPQAPPAGRRRPQPQQGSRLQELLERDRAESQQDEDEHQRYRDTRPQPSQPRQPAPRRMQQPQPAAAGSYHTMHQESMYTKGSPSGGHYQQSHLSYDHYYQPDTPTRGYYQTAGYQSYGQESVPISDF